MRIVSLRLVIAFCTLALFEPTVNAVDYTWNVNGPTNGWSRDSTSFHKNWNTGVVFPFTFGVDAFFGSVADAPIFVVDGIYVRNITFGSSQVLSNTGAGFLNLDSDTHIFTVTNAGDTARIDTAMSGNAGFTKAGPGTLVLNGNSGFTGANVISEGTLRLTHGKGLGSTGSSTTVNPGAILELALATDVLNSNVRGSGTINVTGTTTSRVETSRLSNFQGTLNVSTTGTGKMYLFSNLGASATVNVVEGASLQIGATTTANTLNINGAGNSDGYAALHVDYTLAGLVNLLGPSTIGSSQTSSYGEITAKITGNYPLKTSAYWGGLSGSTRVAGYLALSSPESDYPSLTIDNEYAVIIPGASATITNGVIQKGPLGTGPVTLSAGTIKTFTGNTIIDNPLEIIGTTANKTLSAQGNTLVIRSNITGNGSVYVTSDVFSSGGVTLSGDNSGFTGKFTLGPTGQLFNNDTIVLSSPTAGSAAATWDIRGKLNISFAGTGTVQLGALAGEKSADITNTSTFTNKTLSVGALNSDSTFRGEFNGSTNAQLNLIKVGTGTLRLIPEETSTLSSTVIDAGRLLVNAATTTGTPTAYFTGPVTVNAAGTLGGTGNLNSLITINAGGTIAPGDGVGTLYSMGQAWAGGTHFELQTYVQGGSILGGTFDMLQMNNGNLNLSGVTAANPVVIDLVSMSNSTTMGLLPNWNPNNNANWQGFVRIPLGGSITGFAADKFVVDTSDFQNPVNGTFAVVQASPIQLNLVYTANPIPEPGSLFIVVASASGIVAWRRRKKCVKS